MDRLSSRTEDILTTIIADYVITGEPVGSRTISKKDNVGLSSASVRNIMSDLTDMGYITQPHVSAGRIPTDKGYRYYVDKIMSRRPTVDDTSCVVIETLLREAGMDIRDVLKQSSVILAGFSKQAGIVTATAPGEQKFRTIEFIKVAEDRIVVVLVSASGMIQSKMIQNEDGLGQEELERYSRMLTDLLKDLDLRQARQKIEEELRKEKTQMDVMLSATLRMGHMILSHEAAREIFIEGQTNVIKEPEFEDIEQLKALLTTLEEKSNLLKILDKTLEADGVQVFIGSEHGLEDIEFCSIIAYPIRANNEVLASISVIGPKRMNYGKVVPVVLSTGKVLTELTASIVEHPV